MLIKRSMHDLDFFDEWDTVWDYGDIHIHDEVETKHNVSRDILVVSNVEDILSRERNRVAGLIGYILPLVALLYCTSPKHMSVHTTTWENIYPSRSLHFHRYLCCQTLHLYSTDTCNATST